ncbi:hypothetical protein PMAYCL1PPCAC_12034, partial [Pristionchus mayeri]
MSGGDLEDDSERARERARMQITPRFTDDIDFVSLIVEATENSIENREAGINARGPFESVVMTIAEDGRRIEEERDKLKEKLMEYEQRMNEICKMMTYLLDDVIFVHPGRHQETQSILESTQIGGDCRSAPPSTLQE